MKFLCVLALVFIFMAEITLDSSTPFVRSGAAQGQNLETPSHAALPASLSVAVTIEPVKILVFSEINFPVLAGVYSRIERPPIS